MIRHHYQRALSNNGFELYYGCLWVGWVVSEEMAKLQVKWLDAGL